MKAPVAIEYVGNPVSVSLATLALEIILDPFFHGCLNGENSSDAPVEDKVGELDVVPDLQLEVLRVLEHGHRVARKRGVGLHRAPSGHLSVKKKGKKTSRSPRNFSPFPSSAR